jgi:glutaredoxin-like YruB-family protein
MTGITVYSTPTCPYCHMLKDWLHEKGVKFKDVNVATDQKAAREMIEKSGQMGVPQTQINGKMIVGFDKEGIEKELKKAKA